MTQINLSFQANPSRFTLTLAGIQGPPGSGASAWGGITGTLSAQTDLQAALNGKVASNPAGITGADAITNMVSLTQAEFTAIVSPSATTLYVITDD